MPLTKLRVNDEVLISARCIVEVLSEDAAPLVRPGRQENTPPPPRKEACFSGTRGGGGGGGGSSNNPFDSPSQRTPRRGHNCHDGRAGGLERAALANIQLTSTVVSNAVVSTAAFPQMVLFNFVIPVFLGVILVPPCLFVEQKSSLFLPFT